MEKTDFDQTYSEIEILQATYNLLKEIDMHYKINKCTTILKLNNLELLQNCDILRLYVIRSGSV